MFACVCLHMLRSINQSKRRPRHVPWDVSHSEDTLAITIKPERKKTTVLSKYSSQHSAFHRKKKQEREKRERERESVKIKTECIWALCTLTRRDKGMNFTGVDVFGTVASQEISVGGSEAQDLLIPTKKTTTKNPSCSCRPGQGRRRLCPPLW